MCYHLSYTLITRCISYRLAVLVLCILLFDCPVNYPMHLPDGHLHVKPYMAGNALQYNVYLSLIRTTDFTSCLLYFPKHIYGVYHI